LTTIRDQVSKRLVAYPAVTAPVTCAHRDLEGGVWLGGPGGLWQVRGGAAARVALPAEATGSEVQAIARDRDGTLWFAARGKGTFRRRGGTWTRFDAPRGVGEQPVITVVADRAGRTWLGYTRSRLVRVAGDSVRVYSEADGLRVGNVTALYVRGERVWVGGEHGVAVQDDAGHAGSAAVHGARFRPLGVAGGPLRGVTGIVETAAGDLWLNGADGVTRVPAAEVGRAIADSAYLARAERLDFHDGLDGPAPQMRPLPSAVQGTDGRLWFSTERGVAWVQPENLRRNHVAPPVQIRLVRAGGRRYAAAAGRVALPKRTTELQIEYTALSLSVPRRVRFRYRLAGRGAGWREVAWQDTSWQDAGARREAIYTNLGPGTYRFQVTAANDDGVWNAAGAALDVVIPPTFAQTNAFLVLCAAAAAAALWLLVQWRQRRVAASIRARFDATLAERTRIAQELHDTLLQGFTGVTAQLYAVRRLLASRPADAAETLSSALAMADAALRDARYAVWEMRSPELNERDLPDALAAAAQDALAATSTSLQLMVRGDRRPLPRAVEVTAFRIGREAVTNAAKHANAREVALDLDYGPRTLTLSVRDDGRGVALADVDGAGRDGHWGVVGMRERARNAGGTLDIAAAPGGGTQVTVSLPLHDGRAPARQAAD
jgi:signal transduction histidine kinase